MKNTMELLIIICVIVSIATLVAFFMMAINVSKIKKITKIQMEYALFDSEYYLNLMKGIGNMSTPEHQDTDQGESAIFSVIFSGGGEKIKMYRHRELGIYSCFFGGKEVYFRTKEDAIKGLYLFINEHK